MDQCICEDRGRDKGNPHGVESRGTKSPKPLVPCLMYRAQILCPRTEHPPLRKERKKARGEGGQQKQGRQKSETTKKGDNNNQEEKEERQHGDQNEHNRESEAKRDNCHRTASALEER